MIRHLVGWKLTGETEEARAEGIAAVTEALESLVGVVPGLLDLTVLPNAADIAGNSDLGLIAHYESVDDLRVYVAHPAHQAALGTVRAHTADRWAIDYEL